MNPSPTLILICQFLGFAALVSAMYFGTVIMRDIFRNHVPFSRWGTYAFTDDFKHPHKGLVAFGCYGAVLIGLVCFVLGAKLMRERLASHKTGASAERLDR